MSQPRLLARSPGSGRPARMQQQATHSATQYAAPRQANNPIPAGMPMGQHAQPKPLIQRAASNWPEAVRLPGCQRFRWLYEPMASCYSEPCSVKKNGAHWNQLVVVDHHPAWSVEIRYSRNGGADHHYSFFAEACRQWNGSACTVPDIPVSGSAVKNCLYSIIFEEWQSALYWKIRFNG